MLRGLGLLALSRRGGLANAGGATLPLSGSGTAAVAPLSRDSSGRRRGRQVQRRSLAHGGLEPLVLRLVVSLPRKGSVWAIKPTDEPVKARRNGDAMECPECNGTCCDRQTGGACPWCGGYGEVAAPAAAPAAAASSAPEVAEVAEEAAAA